MLRERGALGLKGRVFVGMGISVGAVGDHRLGRDLLGTDSSQAP